MQASKAVEKEVDLKVSRLGKYSCISSDAGALCMRLAHAPVDRYILVITYSVLIHSDSNDSTTYNGKTKARPDDPQPPSNNERRQGDAMGRLSIIVTTNLEPSPRSLRLLPKSPLSPFFSSSQLIIY